MYTVEVYKQDRRLRSGQRLKLKVDLHSRDLSAIAADMELKYPASQGYRCDTHTTMVTRRNLQTGLEYQERYDTPYFCSPSRDAYWAQ